VTFVPVCNSISNSILNQDFVYRLAKTIMQATYTASTTSSLATIEVGQTAIQLLQQAPISVQDIHPFLVEMDEAFGDWRKADDEGDDVRLNLCKLRWLKAWVSYSRFTSCSDTNPL
jgi:hypothetical protein